uniref:Uncharacterized protein n=1 Tax=Knipowitschia caucasica TaxID=637954 RepID=A0AAV2J244_KNICA
MNYFKRVDAQKRTTVLDALLKIQNERGQSTGTSEELIEMVVLLLAHFAEKEEHLLQFIDKTSLAEDVQMENVPPTPCLIVCDPTAGSKNTSLWIVARLRSLIGGFQGSARVQGRDSKAAGDAVAFRLEIGEKIVSEQDM